MVDHHGRGHAGGTMIPKRYALYTHYTKLSPSPRSATVQGKALFCSPRARTRAGAGAHPRTPSLLSCWRMTRGRPPHPPSPRKEEATP